jgi:hypothetical protein
LFLISITTGVYEVYIGWPSFLSQLHIEIFGISTYIWVIWALHLLVIFRLIVMSTGTLQPRNDLSELPQQSTLGTTRILLVKWIAVVRRSWSWVIIYCLPWIIAGVVFDLLPDFDGPKISAPTIAGLCLIVALVIVDTLLCTALGIAARVWLRSQILASVVALLVRLLPIIVFCIAFTANPPTRGLFRKGDPRDRPISLGEILISEIGSGQWLVLSNFAEGGVPNTVNLVAEPNLNRVSDINQFQGQINLALDTVGLDMVFIGLTVVIGMIGVHRYQQYHPGVPTEQPVVNQDCKSGMN